MEQDIPPFFKEKFLMLAGLSSDSRRWIYSAGTFFLGVCVLVIYFQSGPKAIAFARAQSLFAKWEASPQDPELFQEMSRALRKLPALQEKYQALIAQKLIEGGRGADAIKMAYGSLELAKNEVPWHASFAETSLLIEQGEYQKALERAVALKEQMGRESDISLFSGDRLVGGSVLYGYNLLRIACLQQELKNEPGERAGWEELDTFLKRKEGSPVFNILLSLFHEKGVDLSQYIAERKAALKE